MSEAGETLTVDEAAALAGCSRIEFSLRARRAGIAPLHYVRVGNAMRGVYAKVGVEVVMRGGPGSALVFDRVAEDLGLSPDRLAEVIGKYSRGPSPSLAVPARYRGDA